MNEKTKKILPIVGAFAVGAVAAALIMPSKTVIKREEVVKEVEVEVEKVVEVVKEVQVEKEVIKSERKVTRSITYPDGTRVEEEIYESNEQQLARIQESLEKSFAEKLRNKEKELETKYSKVVQNPKKLTILAGINPQREFAASLSYNVIGPISVGAIGTQSGDIYLGVGLQF